MNKELTKEEILENWGIFDSNEAFNSAYEAMQQFADQEKKKEAIAFKNEIERIKNLLEDEVKKYYITQPLKEREWQEFKTKNNL